MKSAPKAAPPRQGTPPSGVRSPLPAPEPAPEPGLRLLLRQLRPQAGRLAAGTLLSLLGGLLGLVQPVAARSVIEALSAHRSALGSAAYLAALVVAGSLLGGAGGYLLQCTAEGVARSARQRLATRVLRLPVAEFDRLSPGDLVARLTSDTTLLRAAAGQALAGTVTSLLLILGGLVAMLLIDPVLCAAAVGVLVLIGLAAVLALPRINRTARQAQAVVGELGSVLERALGAFRTVKANGLERRLTAQAHDAAERAWRSGVRAAGWEAAAETASGLAGQLAFLVVLGLGGARVATGALTAPALIAFLFYLVFVGPLLTQLTAGAGMLQRGLAAVQRLAEIESLPVELVEPVEPVEPAERAEAAERAGPAACAAPVRPAALSFRAVTFRYPGRTRDALAGLTLDLPAGGLTALVGPSGAGKSTAFALLERFHEPTGGGIALDGRDLRHWPLGELRAAIGYVEQESPVLAGTLRENLCAAAATEDELCHALTLTRLDALVAQLPQGLDTQLGERGAGLSGGQRQRVAIARALLRRPRLLLLDEATAHLDAANEQALREVVAEIARSTTVLVIAHRLSTVTDADRIAVLDGGRLRAVGRHDELLGTDALYTALARTQLLTPPTPLTPIPLG